MYVSLKIQSNRVRRFLGDFVCVSLFFFPHWDLKQHYRTYSIHIME